MTFDLFIRRQLALLKQCLPNSVLVVRGASEVTRSRDTEFPFRQDSDFFYLTGFNEPDSWLLLSNKPSLVEKAQADMSSVASESAFRAMAVRPSDPEQEIWHGRRLGIDNALASFALDTCCASDEVDEAITTLLDGHENLYFCFGHHHESDELIQHVLSHLKSSRNATAPSAIIDWQPIVHEMRLFKSSEELDVMQRAADISCEAHIKAMLFATPGCFEYQLAAEIHHTFAMHGAASPAYNTIVGAGENACILHYTENGDAIEEGALVLIDAGAELNGYAADITRTFPVNGVFSAPQRELYELVLSSQLAALDCLKPKTTIQQANHIVVEILTQGLIELGILKGGSSELIANKAYRRFYMHGLGHWLGLDVHDVGEYKIENKDRQLAPGMVLTVEPGLYIPNEPDIPACYRGIGIRIEDNIVITETGNRVLTANVPKHIDDIERIMSKRATSV